MLELCSSIRVALVRAMISVSYPLAKLTASVILQRSAGMSSQFDLQLLEVGDRCVLEASKSQ